MVVRQTVKVRSVGGTLVITVPQKVVKIMGLTKDDHILWWAADGDDTAQVKKGEPA